VRGATIKIGVVVGGKKRIRSLLRNLLSALPGDDFRIKRAIRE
jgi:hypothetical protein